MSKSRQDIDAPANSSRSSGFGHKGYVAAFAAILLVAAGLRVTASLNEFWLDEVWSYYISGEMKSPVDALTKIHHDNNHPLNTMLMYWIGPDKPVPVYRIPAILAGVGTVALAGLIALKWGRAESMAAMILTASSFLLIQYSSEARGYAPAVFFSMLCLLLGLKYVEKPRLWIAALLWVFLAAAVLSHLTAGFFYASFLLWSLYALVRGSDNWKRALRAIVTLHAVPLAMLAVYYLTCVRQFLIGGGTDDGTLNVLSRVLSLWVGAPLGAAGAIVGLAAVLGGTALGLWLLVRRPAGLWVFFAGIVVLLPTLLVTALRPKALFERYFLICLSFGLVLLGLALGWLYRRGAWGKIVFFVVLAGFLAGNGYHTAWLFKVGRGHCIEAIQYIERNTADMVVRVAGDQDYRTTTMLQFYLPRASFHKSLAYMPWDKAQTEVPEWFLQDRRQYAPPARYVPIRGHAYELAASYEIMSPQHPFCLSGCSWYVYRLAPGMVVLPGP